MLPRDLVFRTTLPRHASFIPEVSFTKTDYLRTQEKLMKTFGIISQIGAFSALAFMSQTLSAGFPAK